MKHIHGAAPQLLASSRTETKLPCGTLSLQRTMTVFVALTASSGRSIPGSAARDMRFRFTITLSGDTTVISIRSARTSWRAARALAAAFRIWIPDWNAIGVVIMRMTTSTKETSINGVMFTS